MFCELNDVTFLYAEDSGVRNLKFKLEPGITGFLGMNGAGKTTTFKLISRQIIPQNGFIDFHNIASIGYLPEKDFFYPHLTCEENLKFAFKLAGIKNNNTKLSELIDRFGINSFLKKYFDECSQGMKRIVQLVSTVIKNPDIYIFDEPTIGLDIITVNHFYSFVKELSNAGKIVFLSSHILEMVSKISDKIIMIDEGRLFYNGSNLGEDKLLNIFLEKKGIKV